MLSLILLVIYTLENHGNIFSMAQMVITGKDGIVRVFIQRYHHKSYSCCECDRFLYNLAEIENHICLIDRQNGMYGKTKIHQ